MDMEVKKVKEALENGWKEVQNTEIPCERIDAFYANRLHDIGGICKAAFRGGFKTASKVCKHADAIAEENRCGDALYEIIATARETAFEVGYNVAVQLYLESLGKEKGD